MCRDDQPLAAGVARAIMDRFGEYLQRSGKSQESAARSMGIASATLSAVLSGTYAADPEPHVRAIDKWLEIQLAREKAPKPAGFARIGVTEQIFGVYKWVTKTNSIGLIHGPNGCGKTMTLHAIRAETPGAIYVSLESAGRTPRAVLEGIMRAVRAGVPRINASQLFHSLTALLKDTNRLIIIDEIHKLAGRMNDDALHTLRDLHDSTGCPMLWAGNGKIASYLREGHSDGYDPLDQIFGRISWWLDLTEKAQGGGQDGRRLYTVEEIRRVFAASKIRLTPDAERYLAVLANDPALGCLRQAKWLVGMAEVVAKGQPITEAMLKAIQRDRLGRRAAEMVELQLEELNRVLVA